MRRPSLYKAAETLSSAAACCVVSFSLCGTSIMGSRLAMRSESRAANSRAAAAPALSASTNYRKRAVIAFDVHAETVSVIGVFYGGQDYETILQEDSDEDDTEH